MGLTWSNAPSSTSCSLDLVARQSIADISEYVDASLGTKTFELFATSILSTYDDPDSKCLTYCSLIHDDIDNMVTKCAEYNENCFCDKGKTVYYVDEYFSAPNWETGWA